MFPLETNAELVWASQTVKKILPDHPKILYPACWRDISLEKTFSQASITYLDPSDTACEALKNDTKRKVLQLALPIEQDIGKYDLIVLMNQNGDFSTSDVARHLSERVWYILALWLSWNFDAEAYLLDEWFDLERVLLKEGDNDWIYTLSQENLEDYRKTTGNVILFDRPQFKRHAAWYLFSHRS